MSHLPSAVVRFLSGEGRDAAARHIEDVIGFNDVELEGTHDYVQWLFPLPMESRAVPGSPLLTRRDIDAIRASDKAQEHLRAAADRLDAFYESNDHWLVAHDHNHLRITRIIRSLRILVDADDAEAFHDTIMRRVALAGRPVSSRSMWHWRDALGHQ